MQTRLIVGDAFVPNGLLLDSQMSREKRLENIQRNIMRSMGTSGDGAVRRDRTSDLQLIIDSTPA